MDREECIATINSVIKNSEVSDVIILLKHLCELKGVIFEGHADIITCDLVLLINLTSNIINALLEEHKINSITKDGKLIIVY